MNTDKTYEWTQKDTVQEITDNILPVVEDNIWDIIMADNDFNKRYGNLRSGKEIFLFDFEIYKSIINKLYKDIKKEANLKTK